MKDNEIIEKAKILTSDFLTQMGLDADITAEFIENESIDEEKANVRYLEIQLEGDNLNELIGRHGRNLESAQVILGLMLSRELDSKDVRVLLEINNYKEGREKYLESHALRAADQVRESGQDLALEPMKPGERRIIHMTLKGEAGIETYSEGEGRDRHIVIRKTS